MGNIFLKLVLFNEEKTLSLIFLSTKRGSLRTYFTIDRKIGYGSFYLILWPR